MSLCDKFKPKKISDIIGNYSQINNIIKWLSSWNSQSEKALLIYGQSGIGKNSSIDVIVNELKYNKIEINASDKRDVNVFEYLSSVIKSSNDFFNNNNKRILIIDEIDCMTTSDKGGILKLKELIKNTNIPIICIANDLNKQKLTPIKSVCKKIEFFACDAQILTDKIYKLISYENTYNLSKKNIENIVISSKGDIRNILNTIHMKLTKSNKDEILDINILDAVKYYINNKNISSEYQTSFFNIDGELMPYYIHNIYPNFINNIDDLNKSAENLSDYNIYYKFCNMEYLISNIVKKGNTYNGFIQFPTSLSSLNTINKYTKLFKKYNIDIYNLSVIYETFFKKLLDKTITDNELSNCKYEKDDMYDIIEHFYKKKVPTDIKKKINFLEKSCIKNQLFGKKLCKNQAC
jgi:DNA polymerase III delta prime subunit